MNCFVLGLENEGVVNKKIAYEETSKQATKKSAHGGREMWQGKQFDGYTNGYEDAKEGHFCKHSE